MVIESVVRRMGLVMVGRVVGPGFQGSTKVPCFCWTLLASAGAGWETHAGPTSASDVHERH